METHSPTPSAKFSPEERAQIVRSFEAWLDSVLASEAPPQGLTAQLLSALQSGDALPPVEGACDLYSLWSAMTALAQEVKLQSRTFKQLNDTLARSLDACAAENRDAPFVTGGIVENSSTEPSRTGQARRQEIDVLLDLRDRVERGRSTACSAAKELAPSRLPRLARWLGVGSRYARHTQEILAALAQGSSLTLDRLDQALLDRHVGVIVFEGQMFDPQRMTAVDVQETDSLCEGTVVEVYRNGYEWEGQVYRPAQVKVARLQGGNSQ